MAGRVLRLRVVRRKIWGMAKTAGTYSLDAARALALHAQGLGAPPPPRDAGSDADAVYDAVERVGWLQIDTLQVVRRSQYVALWSRLGEYDVGALDGLAYGNGGLDGRNSRRLFEYWMHAACIMPLAMYRYAMPAMRRHRQPRGRRGEWLAQPGNRALVDAVMREARDRGLVRSADFEREDGKRGVWWDWKPAKIALEHLYNTGDLAIADRVNFQRVYAVADRALPEWVDRTEPTEDEANLYLLERSARALGICAAAQLPDYFHMKRTPAKALVQRLLDDGTLVAVKAETRGDGAADMVVHRDNLPLLERAADGDLTPRHTTFLTPFDSLFWARDRDMQLWGFRQILEAYKPRAQRIWGYFCLPILHNGRLIGRFDPKLERRSGTLRVKIFYLEPDAADGVDEDAAVADIAAAMRSFMAFHGAADLVVERGRPRGIGRRLARAM